jgi:hypothetical protein
MSALIAAVIAAGYLLAMPALIWGLVDIAKIPGGVWRHAAERPRHVWRIGIMGAYLLGGWPAFVAVLGWWRSRERADLMLEWEDLSVRKRLPRHRHDPPRAIPASITVLVEHDETPSPRTGRADAEGWA